MALYVVNVPDPPAGADWTTEVPGQYLWHVTSVSATLTEPTTVPTVMVDSSGNGNDGIYHNGTGGDPLGPGAFVGANAALWQRPGSTLDNRYGEIDSGIDAGIAFSFDCWIKGDPAADGAAPWAAEFTSSVLTMYFNVAADGTITYLTDKPPVQEAFTDIGALPFDGNYHHVGLTDDKSAPVIYVDGVAQTTHLTGTFSATPGAAFVYAVGRAADGVSGVQRGYFGQPAFYQSVLSAGAFAAHYAAGTSLAAYATAVLADSPINFYELADGGTGTGPRSACLEVTDGTHDVVDIAPPAPNSGANVRTYSWLPQIANDFTNADGSVTIVGIPDLIVPAGYTIGTRTLDLDPADQWSDVTVWWSDDRMSGPLSSYQRPAYRNTLLVPPWIAGAPQ